MSEEQLIPVPMPSLVSLLLRAEQDKGALLTESEVIAMRDRAACVMMPLSGAREIWQARGYGELHLDHVWESWQAFHVEYPELFAQPAGTPAAGPKQP